MSTIKVKFRPSTVAGRPGSIVYLVTRHRIVRQITTDYKVFPSEWNKKWSTVIASASDNERATVIQSISQRLCWDIDRFNRIINNFNNRRCDYSSDDVIAEFQHTMKENTLFRFMESTILRLRQLKHTGTANNYRAALNSFKRFREDEDISVEAIDYILIEDYQAYLKTTGLAPNSISFYMRILRAVYNRAIEQELTQDRKPFRFAFTSVEKTLKRAITLKDIKRIKDLDLSSMPNIEIARDIFLFLFFCRGMSFIDAAFLKKADMQNGMLTYRRHKTNQLLHIRIVNQIREIIDRYSVKKSPYLLPIISIQGINERKQYESALRRTNNALKKVAKKIKLPIPLTTYVARHTWATIAKQKNVPVSVISDALGHDSETTTQIYLASIDTSTIDRVNDLIIEDL